MGDVVHVSRLRLQTEEEGVRRAFFQGPDGPVVYGHHGGIKEFYGRRPPEEHLTTLDHLVGALTG
ncbi:MAG: hypothetical protein ACE5IG_03360 [Dehalococcoidia bacterium]